MFSVLRKAAKPGLLQLILGLATTPAGTMGPITVEVVSKNITLPDNTATLTAYALPEAPSGSPYSYEWTLTSEGSMKGEMENKSQMMLKVSKLEEGTYTFKVKVTSQAVPGLVGEATASVNVFPGKIICISELRTFITFMNSNNLISNM